MGLYGALRSGVSSLFANSQRMAMISDNIANVNTVGYKRVDARFSTFITQSASRGLYNSGGVRTFSERENGQQGILEPTSFSTDFAITGDGYFVVTDAVQREDDGSFTPSGATSFTRAGQFRMNRDGNLVNTDGQFLLSWGPTASTASRSITPIFAQTNQISDLRVVNLAQRALNPEPTTRADIGVNLNANTDTNGFATAFSVQFPLVDRQGTPHTLDLLFVKPQTQANADVSNEWLMYAQFPGGVVNSVNENDNARILSVAGAVVPDSTAQNPTTRNGTRGLLLGSVTFNADGTLQTINEQIAAGSRRIGDNISDNIPELTNANANIVRGSPTSVTLPLTQQTGNSGRFFLMVDFDGDTTSPTEGIEDDQNVLINLGTVRSIVAGVQSGGSDGVTQFGGSRNSTISTIKFLEQNGMLYTGLSEVAVADRGILEGVYENGETRGLYQIPVFTFSNPNGLRSLSGNLFGRSREAGEPMANVSGAGGAGTVVGSAVENSATDIDIANEFSNMIITQRSYSAATRVITTTDEMLQELSNIIR